MSSSKIAVLYGSRQAGKTTLAQRLAQETDNEYRYFNCDEPDIARALTNKTSTELKRYIGPVKTIVVDEGQRVPNIGITLKLLADNFPWLKIIATGSSSFELANAINEPLTGRAYYFTVWPLALAELQSNSTGIELDRIVNDLLIHGAYPVVALSQVADVDRYLGDLTNNYLYRDLLSQGVIRSEATLMALLRALALQLGGEVNQSELSRTLGVDVATIKRLIDLLEKAFIVHRLRPLSKKPRHGIRKLQKIYFNDLGVRNYLIGNLNPVELRTDAGALWENFCVNELRKLHAVSSQPINSFFWRNYAGAEVDYIEERTGQLYPYEFKWGSKKPRLPKDYIDNFGAQPLTVISRESYQPLLEKL